MAEQLLTLTVPTGTYEERHEFVEIVREKLRREHNAKGVDFTDGKITKVEWEAYKDTVFMPKNTAIDHTLLALRAEVKDTVRALSDGAPTMVAVDMGKVFKAAVVIG